MTTTKPMNTANTLAMAGLSAFMMNADGSAAFAGVDTILSSVEARERASVLLSAHASSTVITAALQEGTTQSSAGSIKLPAYLMIGADTPGSAGKVIYVDKEIDLREEYENSKEQFEADKVAYDKYSITGRREDITWVGAYSDPDQVAKLNAKDAWDNEMLTKKGDVRAKYSKMREAVAAAEAAAKTAWIDADPAHRGYMWFYEAAKKEFTTAINEINDDMKAELLTVTVGMNATKPEVNTGLRVRGPKPPFSGRVIYVSLKERTITRVGPAGFTNKTDITSASNIDNNAKIKVMDDLVKVPDDYLAEMKPDQIASKYIVNAHIPWEENEIYIMADFILNNRVIPNQYDDVAARKNHPSKIINRVHQDALMRVMDGSARKAKDSVSNVGNAAIQLKRYTRWSSYGGVDFPKPAEWDAASWKAFAAAVQSEVAEYQEMYEKRKAGKTLFLAWREVIFNGLIVPHISTRGNDLKNYDSVVMSGIKNTSFDLEWGSAYLAGEDVGKRWLPIMVPRRVLMGIKSYKTKMIDAVAAFDRFMDGKPLDTDSKTWNASHFTNGKIAGARLALATMDEYEALKTEVRDRRIAAAAVKKEDCPFIPQMKSHIKMFPHQALAMAQMDKLGPRAIIDMSMGGGKTSLMFSDAMIQVGRGNVKHPAILMPTNTVPQQVDELVNVFGDGVNIIALTSGTWKLFATTEAKRKEAFKLLVQKSPPNTIVLIGYDWLKQKDGVVTEIVGERVNRAGKTVQIKKKRYARGPYLIDEVGIDMVTRDESHRAKNTGALQKALEGMSNAKVKRIASGTIAPNDPADVYNQLAWLDPASVGTKTEFLAKLGVRKHKGRVYWSPASLKKMQSMMFDTGMIQMRRTYWMHLLPERVEKQHAVTLPDHLQKLYDNIFEAIIKDLSSDTKLKADWDKWAADTGATDEDSVNTAAILQKLKVIDQFLSNPTFPIGGALEEKDEATGIMVPRDVNKAFTFTRHNIQEMMKKDPEAGTSPKVGKVVSLIDEHFSNPKNLKVIVFTQFKKNAEYYAKHIAEKSTKINASNVALFWSGRKSDLHKFKTDPNIKVLVAVDAGLREGHNLQMANRAIRVDLHWDPGVTEQVFGRVYRPVKDMSKHPGKVYIDTVVCDNTGEVAKLGRLLSKYHLMRLANSTIDGGSKASSVISPIILDLDTIKSLTDINDTQIIDQQTQYNASLTHDLSESKKLALAMGSNSLARAGKPLPGARRIGGYLPMYNIENLVLRVHGKVFRKRGTSEKKSAAAWNKGAYIVVDDETSVETLMGDAQTVKAMKFIPFTQAGDIFFKRVGLPPRGGIDTFTATLKNRDNYNDVKFEEISDPGEVRKEISAKKGAIILRGVEARKKAKIDETRTPVTTTPQPPEGHEDTTISPVDPQPVTIAPVTPVDDVTPPETITPPEDVVQPPEDIDLDVPVIAPPKRKPRTKTTIPKGPKLQRGRQTVVDVEDLDYVDPDTGDYITPPEEEIVETTKPATEDRVPPVPRPRKKKKPTAVEVPTTTTTPKPTVGPTSTPIPGWEDVKKGRPAVEPSTMKEVRGPWVAAAAQVDFEQTDDADPTAFYIAYRRDVIKSNGKVTFEYQAAYHEDKDTIGNPNSGELVVPANGAMLKSTKISPMMPGKIFKSSLFSMQNAIEMREGARKNSLKKMFKWQPLASYEIVISDDTDRGGDKDWTATTAEDRRRNFLTWRKRSITERKTDVPPTKPAVTEKPPAATKPVKKPKAAPIRTQAHAGRADHVITTDMGILQLDGKIRYVYVDANEDDASGLRKYGMQWFNAFYLAKIKGMHDALRVIDAIKAARIDIENETEIIQQIKSATQGRKAQWSRLDLNTQIKDMKQKRKKIKAGKISLHYLRWEGHHIAINALENAKDINVIKRLPGFRGANGTVSAAYWRPCPSYMDLVKFLLAIGKAGYRVKADIWENFVADVKRFYKRKLKIDLSHKPTEGKKVRENPPTSGGEIDQDEETVNVEADSTVRQDVRTAMIRAMKAHTSRDKTSGIFRLFVARGIAKKAGIFKLNATTYAGSKSFIGLMNFLDSIDKNDTAGWKKLRAECIQFGIMDPPDHVEVPEPTVDDIKEVSDVTDDEETVEEGKTSKRAMLDIPVIDDSELLEDDEEEEEEDATHDPDSIAERMRELTWEGAGEGVAVVTILDAEDGRETFRATFLDHKMTRSFGKGAEGRAAWKAGFGVPVAANLQSALNAEFGVDVFRAEPMHPRGKLTIVPGAEYDNIDQGAGGAAAVVPEYNFTAWEVVDEDDYDEWSGDIAIAGGSDIRFTGLDTENQNVQVAFRTADFDAWLAEFKKSESYEFSSYHPAYQGDVPKPPKPTIVEDDVVDPKYVEHELKFRSLDLLKNDQGEVGDVSGAIERITRVLYPAGSTGGTVGRVGNSNEAIAKFRFTAGKEAFSAALKGVDAEVWKHSEYSTEELSYEPTRHTVAVYSIDSLIPTSADPTKVLTGSSANSDVERAEKVITTALENAGADDIQWVSAANQNKLYTTLSFEVGAADESIENFSVRLKAENNEVWSSSDLNPNHAAYTEGWDRLRDKSKIEALTFGPQSSTSVHKAADLTGNLGFRVWLDGPTIKPASAFKAAIDAGLKLHGIKGYTSVIQDEVPYIVRESDAGLFTQDADPAPVAEEPTAMITDSLPPLPTVPPGHPLTALVAKLAGVYKILENVPVGTKA